MSMIALKLIANRCLKWLTNVELLNSKTIQEKKIAIHDLYGFGKYFGTRKYQNHIGGSFVYKVVCVDDQFIKPFKSYLGKDDVHKFIINMVKGSKYCSCVMKKLVNKEHVMVNEDNEHFLSSTKC